MNEFKVGDIVARKSYNYDILFKITKINSDGTVNLVGKTVRIVADAMYYDLKLMSKEEINTRIENNKRLRKIKIDRSFNNIKNTYGKKIIYNKNNINYSNEYRRENIYKRSAKVLHIDGDEEYCDECKELYRKMNITAFVYNIPESEQYKHVYNLLQKHKPEILILTGHDAFMKRRNDIYNIDNYKNSKYFIQAILEARRYEHNLDSLVIFAGACQSYYEALISAGANFASAPKRVLIDMTDPLIVAENVGFTPVNEYVSIENIISNTREGISGVGGLQTKGQYRIGIPGI